MNYQAGYYSWECADFSGADFEDAGWGQQCQDAFSAGIVVWASAENYDQNYCGYLIERQVEKALQERGAHFCEAAELQKEDVASYEDQDCD